MPPHIFAQAIHEWVCDGRSAEPLLLPNQGLKRLYLENLAHELHLFGGRYTEHCLVLLYPVSEPRLQEGVVINSLDTSRTEITSSASTAASNSVQKVGNRLG